MSHTEKHTLLCWKLDEELVMGTLVGGDLSLVRSTTRKLTAAFAGALRDPDQYLPQPLRSPTLRRILVPIQPTYTHGGAHFPMPSSIEIPVDAVYGAHPSGGRLCYLPRLECRFFFDNPQQFNALVLHFARKELRALEPEELYQHLLVSPPWLEEVNVAEKKKKKRHVRHQPPPTPRLDAIAEKLPGKKSTNPLHLGAWERQEEIAAVERLLSYSRSNILVVGAPGVGKSTIIRAAIRNRTRSKNAPPFWRTVAQRLTAGAKYLGDWQQQCDQIAAELSQRDGTLWVEDIISMLNTGGSGPEDSVAAFWMPLLDRGTLRLIGEVTPRALEKAQGLLPGFIGRFQPVLIPEMSPPKVRRVIDHYANHTKQEQNILFPGPARRLTNRLLQRHVRYERFPGKAIRMMSDLIHHAQTTGKEEVDETLVMDRFITRTGMPRELLDDRILLDSSALRAHFSSRIIGQQAAVDEVCRVITTFKAGLNDPNRPLSTMLFAGPTGVGKTALSKTLAGYLFGTQAEDAPLIRLDMSELQYAGQLQRLIGTTGGEPGELIQRIRQRPFSVVLFDEIEKANPLFFDMLLTILDEGMLSDALGRETDFRGSVIIMTTNLGTGRGGSLGFATAGGAYDQGKVRQFFRPEFFNRIDRVVHFLPLDAQTAARITRLELSMLADREGLRARRIVPEFSDALLAHLVSEGFDPDYGARALKRIIEQKVVSRIGRFLLRQPDLHDARIHVDYHDGTITVRSP